MPTVWIHALLGGMLIGTAASLFLWLNGRVTGISGIFFDAISGKEKGLWRWLFLTGLLVGGGLASTLLPAPFTSPAPTSEWAVIVAGLLVGFGVRQGTGCTSGHGVCGLSRLAPRSILATICFMISGILCVYVCRLLGVIA